MVEDFESDFDWFLNRILMALKQIVSNKYWAEVEIITANESFESSSVSHESSIWLH